MLILLMVYDKQRVSLCVKKEQQIYIRLLSVYKEVLQIQKYLSK
jgi:hypothetical protein